MAPNSSNFGTVNIIKPWTTKLYNMENRKTKAISIYQPNLFINNSGNKEEKEKWEQYEIDKTIVKGLFGPKPQVWTLFMFFHFAVAVAFIGFSVMAYVQWSLKTTNTFALIMVFALPALWILMNFLGRLGKSTGHKQMDELYKFMMKTLEKNT